jgi:SAM-dependent methyltransferase
MSNQLPNWAPPDIDLERPNAARVYDFLLGGACNFEQDRAFAAKLLSAVPEARSAVWHNRSFLRRAVRFCVNQGVRQFLDLGSGIPTVGNVHEIAQDMDPDCRIVYVDNEPVAVAHSELLLEGNDRTGVVGCDVVDADAVLDAAPVRELLDLDQPVAVLMAAVLHFVPDSANPRAAIARYVDAMAPGSYLVLSHVAEIGLEISRDAWRLYDQTSTPGAGRTIEEIREFMAGTEVVPPGVGWISQWRPDRPEDVGDQPELSAAYAAVGRKNG